MRGMQGHSCALSSSGGVSCWGSNFYGQVMLVVSFEGAVVCCGFHGGGVYRADDCGLFSRRLATAPQPLEALLCLLLVSAAALRWLIWDQ